MRVTLRGERDTRSRRRSWSLARRRRSLAAMPGGGMATPCGAPQGGDPCAVSRPMRSARNAKRSASSHHSGGRSERSTAPRPCTYISLWFTVAGWLNSARFMEMPLKTMRAMKFLRSARRDAAKVSSLAPTMVCSTSRTLTRRMDAPKKNSAASGTAAMRASGVYTLKSETRVHTASSAPRLSTSREPPQKVAANHSRSQREGRFILSLEPMGAQTRVHSSWMDSRCACTISRPRGPPRTSISS
mmetsp:Transcript_9175/g.26671  ORF Transcript_9175/g.26671 Transcript_9175/m.26671 type:complete len:244 (+) Transcript_9175:270-1001(+)